MQSSFTWHEIAFEHVQYAFNVTGFRFKATSGVKRTSMLHHVEDEHSCHYQRFLFGKLQRFLSALEVHFKVTIVTLYFQLSNSNFKSTRLVWVVERRDFQDFKIASTPSFCGLDWTFYSYSFTIPWEFSLHNTCIQWPLIPSRCGKCFFETHIVFPLGDTLYRVGS